MIDYDILLKKGFSKNEAKRTIEVIRDAEKAKTTKMRVFDSLVYWILLLVTIVGNLVISIVLVPFLFAFKIIPLYLVIILLAAMFGYLFDRLISDMEHLENRHHLVAWIFIPSLAIINVYYMTSFANYVVRTLELPFPVHSPLFVSAAYVFAFTLPYLVHNTASHYAERY